MCATKGFNGPQQQRGSQTALLHRSQHLARPAPFISAMEGPICFYICRNDSDVLADSLRESAALCPPGEPAPDVAPGFQQKSRGFSVRRSQSAPLMFSHSDEGWAKSGYNSCSGKGGSSYRHTDTCAVTRAGWHWSRSEGLQVKDGLEGSSQLQCQLQALAKLWI